VKRAIDKLRDCIREQRYLISVHANEEMSGDDLVGVDLENAILTGKIAKRFTKDPRGVRHEIIGRACDGRPGAVVCRNISPDWLRIVTIYALENNEP
jgi:hypothetical protein